MRPADMMMRVGVEFYPSAGDFIAEARRMGASKRLPSVPSGAAQNVTRMFLVHPRAILSKPVDLSLDDLFEELNDLAETNGTIREALYGSPWHRDVDLLACVYATKDPQARALLRKNRIKFHPGIIGYFYLAQLQGVVGHEDDDVDEALSQAGVVPVFVAREGK